MKHVMVTTSRKGVFAGFLKRYDADNKRAYLLNARMCVYWSPDMRGVVGLASIGPSEKCRISPSAKSLILEDVTAVFETTPQAKTAWDAAPWKI